MEGGVEQGKGIMGDSNFLCSEYENRENQEANETNSWERDRSCNTGDVTADGKYLGEVDTFGINGIQGRYNAKYSEQR